MTQVPFSPFCFSSLPNFSHPSQLQNTKSFAQMIKDLLTHWYECVCAACCLRSRGTQVGMGSGGGGYSLHQQVPTKQMRGTCAIHCTWKNSHFSNSCQCFDPSNLSSSMIWEKLIPTSVNLVLIGHSCSIFMILQSLLAFSYTQLAFQSYSALKCSPSPILLYKLSSIQKDEKNYAVIIHICID